MRKRFAIEHQKALRFFEKYILPLQTFEYGLDKRYDTSDSKEADSPEKAEMNE